MASKKSKTKVIALSAIVASTTVAGVYANRESIKNNSEENVETAKLLVDKIDKDTVKVSIENVNHAAKAFQLSLKIDGNVQFNGNEESVKWLTSVETNENPKTENIIENDYVLSDDKKSMDIFVTSDNELNREGSIIEVCEIDLNKVGLKSNSDYKIIPSDVKSYKSVDVNNKSIEVANMDYDKDNILKFNTPPKIELKNDIESESGYPKIDTKNNIITIKEGYEFKAKNFILVSDDEDGNIPVDKVEVKDSNGSIMPDSAKNLKIGTYDIIYSVVDNENEANVLNTSLIVEPNVWKELPTITGVPRGPIKLNVGDVFDVYAPEGELIKATDAAGNDIEVIVSGDIDLHTIGTYTITYTAKDRFDNIKTQELVIQVGSDEEQPSKDTEKPVFDYKGKTDIVLGNGVDFETPLVNASDNVDTNVEVIVAIEDKDGKNIEKIDTKKPGKYNINYTATDKSGNKAELTINVTVKEAITGVEIGSGNATSENKALNISATNKASDLQALLDEVESDKYTAKVYGKPTTSADKSELTYNVRLYKKQSLFARLFKSNKNEEVYYVKLTVKNTKEFKDIMDKLEVIGVEPENPNPTPPSVTITDVPVDHWARKEIYKFINLGYIDGYEDNTFRPDNNITRAEFVKLVNRVFNLKVYDNNSNFLDVNKSDWFYKEVAIGVKAGYINGYEDNTFKPDKYISREESAKILATLLNVKGDGNLGFNDKHEISDWALKYVDALTDNNIIDGYEDNTFRPLGNTSRAETVKLLDRSRSKIK